MLAKNIYSFLLRVLAVGINTVTNSDEICDINTNHFVTINDYICDKIHSNLTND